MREKENEARVHPPPPLKPPLLLQLERSGRGERVDECNVSLWGASEGSGGGASLSPYLPGRDNDAGETVSPARVARRGRPPTQTHTQKVQIDAAYAH